jgi:predicted small lipoprotein YifL
VKYVLKKSRDMKRNILYCVLLLMLMIACGKKGPPMAPTDTTPNSVNDLSVAQKGDMAVLTWTLPSLTVDNTPLADFKEAEVYSFSQNLSTLTSSEEDLSLKDILSDKDVKKKFRKKAEKIFTIDKANSKLYFTNKKFNYEADLDLEKNPLNFKKFFSFAVKVAGPDGKKSQWSNIVGIPPWAVPRAAQNLKAELKEDEIIITWEPPQENIDGSQPPHVLGYNIYLYSQKDKKTKKLNDKLLLSGPQEWEFSRLTAIDTLQTEEGENILQLSVDKTTTSSYLYQDLTEEQNLTEMKGKTLNIKFEARTLNEEEVHGSIFLDDGVNKWGSQNEKEMNLTNQWKEFGYNIQIDEKAIKLTLYIKPTLYPADVTFQIKNVQALLMEGEKSKEEKEKEKIETFLEEMLEEEKKKEEADQEVVEELKEEKEPVNIIRNGDFLLLNENTFSDKLFKFNEHYFYSVRAVCRKWGLTGESSDSQKLEIIPLDTFPPLAPAGLSAITGAGIVSLSWNPNKEKDLFGYKIYRRQEEDSAFTVLNNEEPLQKTIFQDDKVTPGKVYIYYITALDNAKPPNESEKSEEIKIRAQ